MSEPPAKRRRTQFSVAEKKEIVAYQSEHPKATQLEIASYFSKEWGKQVGRSTVSDILRVKAKWTNASKDGDTTVRQRTGKHENIEQALFLWFSDVRSKNAYVNDQMLVEKAKFFGDELKVDDFQYSRGWLQKFKKRHNIASHVAHGEADSADPTVVSQGRQQLQEDLAAYDPNNIYNMDETGLFYRLLPNSTLATGPVSGTKKQKDRITVALCSNATGTDKLVPLVIGKFQRPRCFGKTFNPSVYVEYTFNRKAWMTGAIFQDWLSKFNRRMRVARRQVILLVDNATSHSTEGLRLTNVIVKFLPPNTTAHIQPMDAGIIRNFKGHYRKLLVKYFLQCIEDEEDQKVSMKLAITYVKEAWASVKQSTIVNCWKHVKILPPTQEAAADSDTDDTDDLPLAELQRLLQRMPPGAERMAASDYVSIDSPVETGEALSDQSILDLVSGAGRGDEVVADADIDADDDEPDPIVTRINARKGLAQAVAYCEQNPALASHLDDLWKAMRAIESLSGSGVQKTMMDFFSR
ncbi:MAG: hypothetical protein AB2535_21740 [Candidatus Thiodiazotropha endolucinida]